MQSILDALHSPEGKKISGGALTEFVTEVQIGHCQPAFAFLKKGETTVEQNVFCHKSLAG